ncbi:MAG: VCBS repeat-containing protein, partial [Myxococcota bacterium]|nr:VCBS repeat-containing protein [Myxococcota bacterium]
GLGVYWATAPSGDVQPPGPPTTAPTPTSDPSQLPEAGQRILANEALTKALGHQLELLGEHYLAAASPKAPFTPTHLFDPKATSTILVRPEGLDGPLTPGTFRVKDWRIAQSEASADAAMRTYLDILDRVERAHFEIEYGRHESPAGDRADSLFHLELVGRSRGGLLISARGQVEARWSRAPASGSREGDWRIVTWKTTRFQTVEAEDWFFQDVLDQLVDPATRAALEHSEHEDKVVDFLKHGRDRQPRYPFELASLDRHPGLAVVDINGDGWDDIYVMPRWGTTQLLINQGGQGFVEAAAEWGLALRNNTSSAIFADFDNDGDPDVIIGRTLDFSAYFINEGGRFRQADETATSGLLPQLVSSVSVVDYDGDGLLDVYFSTYASLMAEQAWLWLMREGAESQPALKGYLRDEDAVRLGEMLVGESDFSLFYQRPGPPNKLYRNVGGGRFEPVSSPLERFTNTFQATWSDYDRDGDQDVYLSNDYAANTLFRNDQGRFVDVTEATGTEDMGFGMGATWADYNDDGRFDLYTSNMYSRAGRRITGAIEGIDPRLRRSARGNTLFRNEGDRFVRASSLGPEGLEVERAGWTWG